YPERGPEMPIPIPRQNPAPARAVEPVTVRLKGLKVTTLIPPDTISEGIAAGPGDPVIRGAIDGSDLTVWATINPKTYRKLLRTIAEHGPDNVNVLLQGNLKPGEIPGKPWVLDCAGLTASPKTPKPEASAS